LEVVRHLVTEIGTRLSGSAGEEAAARYLASKFEQIGLEVELERYSFLGWQLLDEPLLEMLSPNRERIPCAPNVYSSSTPEQGAEGTLRLIGKIRLAKEADMTSTPLSTGIVKSSLTWLLLTSQWQGTVFTTCVFLCLKLMWI